MLTELWHIRDEQLVQIPTEVKDDIKQAEDACQTFLDSLEASIADYTVIFFENNPVLCQLTTTYFSECL